MTKKKCIFLVFLFEKYNNIKSCDINQSGNYISYKLNSAYTGEMNAKNPNKYARVEYKHLHAQKCTYHVNIPSINNAL
jgi:hypothetical protein